MVDYMKQTGRYAVITAFTPDFGDDFKIFQDSIRRVNRVPIMVIPLDHSESELLKLRQLNVHVIQFSDEELLPLRNIGPRWMQWFKPSLIKRIINRVGLDTILWLDTDLVVLDDLQPLFEQALESFFVINDYFDPKGCLNDDRLYDIYPTPVVEGQENTALNSGVIGMHWPRDEPIINDWLEKVQIVAHNSQLLEYVSLYDQGALLWSMRDLGILDKILPKPEWNHKAVRNGYEFNKISFKWPTPTTRRMGGDLIDEVKFDNPGVTIAHFAGAPKLSELCKADHAQSRQCRFNKHQTKPITRIFGIGLERAGTHTLAETFRRANKTETWVRHEFEPALSHEAKTKWQGKPYNTKAFQRRLKLYNRSDVQFVSEVNHRLSFFVSDISEAVENAKFILLLRNPVTLVQSRLLNFSCWSEALFKYPGCYQFDVYGLHRRFGSGSDQQNQHRLRPEKWNLNPIEMHIWDIVETLRFVLRDLRKLSKSSYEIIWIEDLAESWRQIENLIPDTIYWDEAKKLMKVHFGARVSCCSKETEQWVRDQINENADLIINSVMDVLREFNVPLQQSIL